MSARTPGPWTAQRAKAADNTGGYDYAILDTQGEIIAECFENVGRFASGAFDARPASTNASFIVEACNAHNQNIGLIENYRATLQSMEQQRTDLRAENERLREALTYCRDHLACFVSDYEETANVTVSQRYAIEKADAALAKDGE